MGGAAVKFWPFALIFIAYTFALLPITLWVTTSERLWPLWVVYAVWLVLLYVGVTAWGQAPHADAQARAAAQKAAEEAAAQKAAEDAKARWAEAGRRRG